VKLRELVKKIQNDPRFEILGARIEKDPADDRLIVGCREGKRVFEIDPDLTDAAWDDYVELFLGQRDPNVMLWITRIIGYFSFVKNRVEFGWNPSKLAELADRHKGDYSVPDVGVIKKEMPVSISTSSITPVSEAEWQRRLREKGIIKDVA